MRILLTGSTGFIGSHTKRALSEKGYDIESFRGDARSISDWNQNLSRNAEIIFHVAAVRTETPEDFSVNTQGIKNFFEAVRAQSVKPKKIVLVSSQAVYLGCIPPFREDMKPRPTTTYGKSKYEAEILSLKESAMLGIPLVILRYSVVLGPGIRAQSTMSGPLLTWAKAGIAGEPIRVFQGGGQIRDYIHVDDVVSANVLAVESLPPGIYNVGGGREVKLIDLATWVQEATGKKSRIVVVGGEATFSDPKRMISDISKLETFGWIPKKDAKEAVYGFIAASL